MENIRGLQCSVVLSDAGNLTMQAPQGSFHGGRTLAMLPELALQYFTHVISESAVLDSVIQSQELTLATI